MLVFATTKETGEGFTKDPHRLCVMHGRAKKFTVIVGDLNTVNWQNFDYDGKQDTIYLEKLNKYFAEHNRVATFTQKQLSIQDAEDAAEAAQSLTKSDDCDEEARRQSRIDELELELSKAKAEFDKYKADKESKERPQDTAPISKR